MKKIKNKALLICLLLLSGTAFSQYQIPNSITGSGGDISSGSVYTFSSTVGEAVIGNPVNTLYQHYTGFWSVYLQHTITGTENQETVPVTFRLEQNYPNPFNPTTKIKYSVPARTLVTIKIYDITGSEIYTLVNEELDMGWYEMDFNAAALSSGVYFYRMQADSYVNIKKMLLIK